LKLAARIRRHFQLLSGSRFYCVGVDAHIDPIKRCIDVRVDVGIDPYKLDEKRATVSVAPFVHYLRIPSLAIIAR